MSCTFQVQCTAETTHDTVEVTLSGLNVTDTDMYRCEIWIFYPPPYLELIGNGTLIHVLGEATALACLSTELKFLVHIFFSVLRFLFSVHRQLQLPRAGNSEAKSPPG